ncbi:MAG: glycosyltransferase [Clostridia bacterium]|nr:glycosyltransferase [Clostridia bacterium]
MSEAKICIITTRNIFNSPCLEKYQNILNSKYDIFYWDRCGIEESCGAENHYKYFKTVPANVSLIRKALPYLGFYLALIKFLTKHRYEKLIVFPTQTAWLMLPWLKGRYKSKYVLDIRDYSGEFGIQGKLTNSVVKSAGLTTITSPAYTSFLPEGDYVISHNIQEIDRALVEQYRCRKRADDAPIVLSFVGSVRFIDVQCKLIDKFKNDPRFLIKFIGRGSENLKDYCDDNNITNVEIIGRFERNELPDFYMQTDIAINVYGNNTPVLNYALSNKLYSAAIMGMPLVVSPDTYMAEIVEKYGFGVAVDLEEDGVADKVYDYYNSLNKQELFDNCDAFMKVAYSDDAKYRESLLDFVEN